MKYLTERDLTYINARIVTQNNETPFVRNPEGLSSLVSLPQQDFFGMSPYPSFESKVGIIFIKLIKLHCFEDGNKRTAVLTLQILCNANDYQITFSDEELAAWTIEIAKTADSDLKYDDIYKKLESHIKKL